MSADYGEPAHGYDRFGERVTLLPERRPAKLEIAHVGTPAQQQQFAAERLGVVKAEDDAYAAGECHRPHRRDFCEWLLNSHDVQLGLIKRQIAEMTVAERERYHDALITLSWTLRDVAAVIDHHYPVTPVTPDAA